ncbi:ubiquinol-cytochrome c reductase iron-sulfur subunit [Cellulomonas massiliensis]|uniref:QcrA and Rieske domain-containing protein n=1 Tax=Cellulomonas massiliensis TaxID=1465811 RepID=UPI0009DA30B3|nr:Rieske (2Fe-2S) protein [Cellulomonas massiliensis]
MSTTTTSSASTVAQGSAPDPAGHACGGGHCLDRRQLLVRAGTAGATVGAVALLAACGESADSPGSGGGGGGAATPGADGSLAKLSDIPVGGAVSATAADGSKILLTQPEAGTVVGLSAVCTHQGCTVLPDDAQLHCPCHGSTFDLEGKNVSGPAPKPLPAFAVRVEDGAVFAQGS